MPKFEVEVTIPVQMKTVIRTSAGTMREAEIAALALVDSHPSSEYKWEVVRPAKPKYHARAKRSTDEGTSVTSITEQTVTQNPAGRRPR